MDYAKESLKRHYEWKGKIEVVAKVPTGSAEDLSLAYTPGVAEPCREIERDPEKAYELTRKHNLVAVITDGSAVLGLGNIGPMAGMPVMEGKCVLFKTFGDVDAIPLCVNTQDVDEFVEAVYRISDSFGGINLEDISAPRCFEIEQKLKKLCRIPVFHDDQHGTAVVASAAIMNAMRLTGRKAAGQKMVISGAGAAGLTIAKLLLEVGIKDVTLCDIDGIVYEGREGMDPYLAEMAKCTNTEHRKGKLADALMGADIFLGVSAPGIVTQDMVRSMNKEPLIFAMANPTPEIFPKDAIAAGAAVVGTGRSDYPNQINNVLAFPGIFRGALDARATDINDAMNIAAAEAIASLVGDDELSSDYILPKAFDPRVKDAVAAAVSKAAVESGVVRAKR